MITFTAVAITLTLALALVIDHRLKTERTTRERAQSTAFTSGLMSISLAAEHSAEAFRSLATAMQLAGCTFEEHAAKTRKAIERMNAAIDDNDRRRRAGQPRVML